MKKTLLMLLLLAQAGLAASASAVQMFDFDAQALMPAGVGGAATVHGKITNGGAVATPLPLDFANYEYTIVVTGLTQDTAGATSQFSGGTIAIYEDAATAASWANAATFTDGTAILTGSLVTFQRTMLTATLGSGAGTVDWTGGTRLNDLAAADQTGWPLLTAVSRAVSQVQPGYTERWDGKVEPHHDVVATESTTWSQLKAGYR